MRGLRWLAGSCAPSPFISNSAVRAAELSVANAPESAALVEASCRHRACDLSRWRSTISVLSLRNTCSVRQGPLAGITMGQLHTVLACYAVLGRPLVLLCPPS